MVKRKRFNLGSFNKVKDEDFTNHKESKFICQFDQVKNQNVLV